MRGTRVDSRYAKSILDLATERGEVDAVYDDMMTIQDACEKCSELHLLLKSPIIKSDKKISILKAVFDGKLTELTSRFINIITSKGRESNLEGIVESFIFLYKAQKNIKSAIVTSAISLDDDTKGKILELVKAKDNVKVDLVEQVDQNIIGGFILRMGDSQIDASIKNKLNKLEKNFSKNLYVADI